MLKRIFLEERNVLFAIIINTIIIFVMYFPQYRGVLLFEWIDHFFILFFLIEAVVKIKHFGRKDYFSNAWNVFDFILVMGSLPSLLMMFFPTWDTSLLIILRVFRLFRIMRFIRFVPDAGKVLKGLGRALKASVFVFITLFIFDVLLAVITCHFYGRILPTHFGDPLISAYTVFQLFTVEGWNEIPAMIAKEMNSPILAGFTRFYFALIVFMGGIMGMSLANAVFVDEMTMDNNAELEAKIDVLESKIDKLLKIVEEIKK